MGCGCGGGRRNTGSKRTTTVVPRTAAQQARPAQPVVQNLSLPQGQLERQEIERKRRIQISLRKKNGSA
jgi:hypothetical protein